MTEDVPRLHPSGTELYQHAQAVLAVVSLSAHIRRRWQARLDNDARLAYADDDHAALLHEARQHPPVRLMTEAEEGVWLSGVPRHRADAGGLDAAERDREFSVWTGQFGEEWAVEARVWDLDTGEPVAATRVVCRSGDDAVELCRWLRDHQRPADLHDLYAAAAGTGRGNVLGQPAAVSPAARRPVPAQVTAAREALGEEVWESALRDVLPAAVADQIIVKDPAHRRYSAWRELHKLASAEVSRVGADPHQLAQIVLKVPTWRDGIRNPPALAHWAISEARTSPTYEAVVRGEAPASDRPASGDQAGRAGDRRVALERVRTHADAVRWARGLDAANPVHRVEAGQGVGHWGGSVDAILTKKFPDLVDVAALRRRSGRARPAAADATTAIQQLGPDVEAADDRAGQSADEAGTPVAELAEYVRGLDPHKAGDRLAGTAMLGRVPVDIVWVLVERFGDDPRFAEKLRELYPDGLPEAAAWRRRTDAAEQGAVASMVPDDPVTERREDLDGYEAAAGPRRSAEHQSAVAAAVEHPAGPLTPAPAARPPRPPVAQPVPTPGRRTRQ